MAVQMRGMNSRSSEKEEVAVNQSEKDCENMPLPLIKTKSTAHSNIFSVKTESKI